MQDQIREYSFNFIQIVLLFALLLAPQIIGLNFIRGYGLSEVNHYFDVFVFMAGYVVIHYFLMLMFHQRLTNRIHDMIYVKYLIVILILFWVIADSYLAYIYQKAYLLNEDKIIRRDIVWRDVAFEDLPADVIYPNFRFAFLFVLSSARAIVVAVLAYTLMTEKKVQTIKHKISRRKEYKEKSLDEIKANLHPSVLKNYNKDNDE